MRNPDSDRKLLAALARRAAANQKHAAACQVVSELETEFLDALQVVRAEWAPRRQEAARIKSKFSCAYDIAKNTAEIAINAHDETLMETLYDSRRKTS